jgi:ribosome-binding protein aMBF1 (putative translation factor)
MNIALAAQQYRTIAEIRGAVQNQKVKLLPAPNAAAIAYRQSLGLSQRAMAKRVGVSASLWNKIEAGERSVPESLRPMMRSM